MKLNRARSDAGPVLCDTKGSLTLLCHEDFLDYLKDDTHITFPWSMIDKITPRPHEKVKEMLATDGFEDNDYIETEKHTFTF